MKKSLTLLLVIILGFTHAYVDAQSYDELEGADIRVYKHASGTDLKISMVYPDNYRKGKKYPAIVFFFGGGWRQGTVQQFAHHCEYLASRGMIAMTANYRVQSRNGTSPFDAVEDARSAMRWIKEHAKELGINKKKILLVMNRFDRQVAITPEKVGHNLGHKVACVLYEDREVVVPGVNRGVPFMLGEGKSKEIGKGILELVGKVRETITQLEGAGIEEV